MVAMSDFHGGDAREVSENPGYLPFMSRENLLSHEISYDAITQCFFIFRGLWPLGNDRGAGVQCRRRVAIREGG